MKNINKINLPSKGYYSLSVKDKDGNIVEDKCINNVNNVITYAGAFRALFDQELTTSYYCKVGTGTTEITRSDTSLGSALAPESSNSSSGRAGKEVDNLDGTSTLTLTRTMTFSLGAISTTISEVGVFSNSGDTFIAGQLIKDELGDPTTVTILSDEQLTVTYTLEWTVPNQTVNVGSGTVTDSNSNTYDYEVWVQPYFREYTINDSNEASKWPIRDDFLINQLCGTTGSPIGGVVETGTGTISRTDGTVTFSGNTITWTPSSTSGTIGFVTMWGTGNTASSNYSIVDTATALGPEGSQAAGAVVVKFLDPVTKTTSDTFALACSFEIEI